MKFFANVRLGLMFALVLVFGGMRAEAGLPPSNGGFGLTVTISTNLYFLNDNVTTSITVSNGTGQFLDNVYVTNYFSAPVLYTSFTNFYTATNTAFTNGNVLSLNFSPMTNGDVATATFTWQHLAFGVLTNTIFVTSDTVTNTASLTNLTRVYTDTADLGVGVGVVSLAYVTNNFWAITNDWVTYQVTVTNLGPGVAAGVLVTNTLPAGMSLISGNGTLSSNNLIYTVGNLATGATTNFQYTVQATNTGALVLTAQVGAPNLYDPNLANNQTNTVLFATNYLSALQVETNTGQGFNPQNGLLEQTIQVVNTNASSAPAVRLVLSGLGTNKIFNASAINSGLPFVVAPAPLASGGPLNLRLQYLTAGTYPFTFPFTNGQLHAYVVPASVLQYTPPPATQTSTNININRLVKLPDGDMLVQFPAVLKQSYSVVYSDNIQFSNAMLVLPAYVAPGNVVQWLDYGPPATVSAPTNSTSRFYRVISNP